MRKVLPRSSYLRLEKSGNFTSAPMNGVSKPLVNEPTTPPNADGWYHTPVTIHWTCADLLSGIAGTCPPDSVIGSEGTLGIVTEVVLRIVRVPESTETVLAAFSTMGDAGEAVSRIIAAGITPAAVRRGG